MKQADFNILFTNVMAIADQTFTIKCGEFVTAASADPESGIHTDAFNMNQYYEKFDFQNMLDTGYASINELQTELNSIWEKLDSAELDNLLRDLPAGLPALSAKLSGQSLKQWIQHTVTSEGESAFYTLHQYISAKAGGVNNLADVLRHAIATDDVSQLNELAGTVQPDQISMEDLITAATIEYYQELQWMLEHVHLSDEQGIVLLSSQIEFPMQFERVYQIATPSKNQHQAVLELATQQGAKDVMSFLNKIRQ